MLPRALGFSASLVAALALTLGLKAKALDYSVGDDQPRFAADLEGALLGQGFTVVANPSLHSRNRVIARRGACTLEARDATRAYEMSSAFALRSGDRYRLTYILGSRRSSTPPALASETLNVGQRTFARLGLEIARPATIAVLDNGRCDVEGMSFTGLKIHMRRH